MAKVRHSQRGKITANVSSHSLSSGVLRLVPILIAPSPLSVKAETPKQSTHARNPASYTGYTFSSLSRAIFFADNTGNGRGPVFKVVRQSESLTTLLTWKRSHFSFSDTVFISKFERFSPPMQETQEKVPPNPRLFSVFHFA